MQCNKLISMYKHLIKCIYIYIYGDEKKDKDIIHYV